MVLGRVERYTIRQSTQGLVITMRQESNALGFSVVALGMLAVIWWFGPHSPRPTPAIEGWAYWAFMGCVLTFVCLGVLGAFYKEQWVVTDRDLAIQRSFTSTVRLPRGETVKLRVEIRPGTGNGGPVFPCVVHVLDVAGQSSGASFEFSLSHSMDQFLKLLRLALPLEIDDRRPGHGPV